MNSNEVFLLLDDVVFVDVADVIESVCSFVVVVVVGTATGAVVVLLEIVSAECFNCWPALLLFIVDFPAVVGNDAGSVISSLAVAAISDNGRIGS